MRLYLTILSLFLATMLHAQGGLRTMREMNNSISNIKHIELRDSSGKQIIGYATSIENPAHIKISDRLCTLKRIELSDTYTRVTMHVRFQPKRWIMAAESYLIDNARNRYDMIRFESEYGIEPKKMFWMPQSGEIDYDIIYPPLKPYATSVTLTFDGDDGDGFYDIQLNRTDLPTIYWPFTEEWMQSQTQPLRELPVPEYKFGFATVKGHIFDFEPGMMKDIDLSTHYVIYDNPLDVQTTKIDSAGNFTFHVPVARLTAATIDRHHPMHVFLSPGETTEIWFPIHPDKRRSFATGPLASLAIDLNSTRRNSPDFMRHIRMDSSDLREYAMLSSRIQHICHSIDSVKGKVTPGMMDELHDICSNRKILLCDAFLQMAGLSKTYNIKMPDVVYNDMKLRWMLNDISHYIPLDAEQAESMATMPESYQELVNYHLDNLSDAHRENLQKHGFEIKSLPKNIATKDITQYILAQHPGKKVFIHCWIPNNSSDKDINSKVIIPLQKEWNEKRDSSDLVFVHIANVRYPQAEWEMQRADLKGEHYAIFDNMEFFDLQKSIVSTYPAVHANALYDEKGKCIWKKSNFPDIEDIRKRLGLRKNDMDVIIQRGISK